MRRTTVAVGLAVSSFAVAAVPAAVPAGARGALRHDLYRLRMCESGGNYHANTGNGYYGAYQFSESTWRGLGFHRRPDLAKRRVQNRAAKKEHAISGWRAWPSCSQREHLR